MARKVRIEYAGAVYHVMARGNQGKAIFRADLDRRLFLDTLAEGCGKTGWRVHAYVLMPDHYHLLLETPEANLVAGMKWFQGAYTQRFNARHEASGHLFEGRYKAIPVDAGSDNHFLVASTYIHLNPARAGLIRVGKEALWAFPWSSYPAYVGRCKERPHWLELDRVLASAGFGPGSRRARERYEALVEGRVLDLTRKRERAELNREWEGLRRGWYLGGADFRKWLVTPLKGAMPGRSRTSYSGKAARSHDEAGAEALLVRGLEALGVPEDALAGMGMGAREKQVLAWWLRSRTTASRGWVSRRLGMGDESRVTQAVREVREAPDTTTRKWLKRLDRLA